MSINQTRFLGASVRGFNMNLGWGSDSSTLSVSLVEDFSAGDAFTNPVPGTPTLFSFNGFETYGIIQDWKYHQGSDGKYYDVNLTDPREILNGTHLILGSVNTTTNSMPNLLNIYGYLEATFGFGGSLLNENGIPWRKIRDAINSIVNTGLSTIYGGIITLRNYAYKIDLTQLPNVPADFRIGGDSITLMDFIATVCDAGACDFFFTLQAGNYITLSTIKRDLNQSPGAIASYISTINGAVSKDIGLEFRNETVGKYVVGANKRDMYFQNYQPGVSGDYSDDTIWPFWGYTQPGFDGAGDVILGTDINNEHTFKVDARHMNLNFPGAVVDTYTMCVGELRAALDSQNTWESYLWFRNDEPGVGEQGNTPTSLMYNGRATKLKLIGNTNSDLYAVLKNSQKDIVLQNQAGLSQKQIQESSLSWDTKHEEEIKRLYDLVHSYASQYYGQKFMVRIPTVEGRIDTDTGKVSWSLEPVSHGFLDEDTWPNAIANNYLPHDINPLLNEEGLIQAYARYDNASLRDFSEISPNDVIFNSGGTSAFVKCDVDEGVGFIDWETQFSPRAIVSVRGAVRTRITGSGTDFGGVFGDLVTQVLNEFAPDIPIPDDEVKAIQRQFSADQICLANRGFIVQPDMISVPLLSNIQRYGPWYSLGANGKVDFEIDDSLSPWNFFSYNAMNLAASGKVTQGYSNMQQAETGSFEVPGAPAFNLGSQLIASGPYITNIQVGVNAQAGVTTRYVMSTWGPKFGAFSKLQQERQQRYNKFADRQKRFNRTILRKAQQQRPTLDANGFIVEPERTPRRQAKSTHTMIVGENIPKRVGVSSGLIPNVGIQPAYLTGAQLHPEEYENKAAASLDTLFRPFTTITNSGLSSRLSHYQVPVSGAESPTVAELNPFASGFGYGSMTRGYEYPDNLGIGEGGYDPSGNYRAMGHRFPMVGVGWGYDVNGKPVPNFADPILNSGLYAVSGLVDMFYPGYLDHPEYWKAAPVDIRYDYDRGIWVAGGGSNTKIVKLLDISTLSTFPSGFSNYASGYPTFPTRPGRNVYYAREYVPTFTETVGEEVSGSGVTLTATSNYFYIGNFRPNLTLVDSYYLAIKVNGKYYLDNQSVFL